MPCWYILLTVNESTDIKSKIQRSLIANAFLYDRRISRLSHDVYGASSMLIGGDTRVCLGHVTRRLLQRSPRRGSENNHRQATTSVECCHLSRQRHQKVRPRTLATDAPGVTLAGHPWASQLQAGHADSPVSARQSASVPVQRPIPVAQVAVCGLLHVISWPFRDIVSALTVVEHSLSLVRWRSTLCQMICETPLSAQQPSDNCWKRTFSVPISMFSALGVSHVMRYINLRYLLTYLLTSRSYNST